MALGSLWPRWLWRVEVVPSKWMRVECPYDELEVSRRVPGTTLTLPARLLLCEGYRRADQVKDLYALNPHYNRHDDAHQTAQALACGEFE